MHIPHPPLDLWVRGSLADPAFRTLAVVGSRALTRYGRSACEYLIRGLSGYPISIISGLALGTDACAHKAALKAGLHTIAVLGSGIDNESIGPRANLGLAHQILESGGALVSERPAGYLPLPYDYPLRNRLMVGMADAVLVVEAAGKSGSLISAKMAANYNRELLCVPHRIGDVNSEGCHQFLRLGAQLVSEPEHVLEALRFDTAEPLPLPESLPLTEDERVLYDVLSSPRSRDEVMRACPLPPFKTLSLFAQMELKSIVKEEFGLWRRA